MPQILSENLPETAKQMPLSVYLTETSWVQLVPFKPPINIGPVDPLFNCFSCARAYMHAHAYLNALEHRCVRARKCVHERTWLL